MKDKGTTDEVAYEPEIVTEVGDPDPCHTGTDDMSLTIWKDTGALPCQLQCTDMGNAHLLIHLFGNQFRYCSGMNTFFCWDGTRWLVDEGKTTIINYAKETVRFMTREGLGKSTLENSSEYLSHAIKSASKGRLNSMIDLASTDERIHVCPEDFDRDNWLLNCQNGTVDFRNGSFREHNPDDMITRLAPVEFDPEQRCPLWEKFLSQITDGDTDLIEYLQRCIGMSFTGDLSEQCFFIIIGNGSNGKSTLLNTISSLLRDYSKNTSAKTFINGIGNNTDTYLAELPGARFVTASELERGDILTEGVIKEVTGGDPITVKKLYKNPFSFRPQLKLFICTNHLPQIQGTDYGIWRRVRVIPLNVRITENMRDKNMEYKLRNEMSGILNWALEGCMDWRRRGLCEPEAVTQATKQYRMAMDSLLAFVEERCEQDHSFRVSKTDFKQSLQDYCNRSHSPLPSQKEVAQRLKSEFNVTEKRTASERFWEGIRLIAKNPYEESR